MTTNNHSTSDHSIDFMLEEFRFLKVSFEGTMEGRNERFKNFINIIFGAAALLATIGQFSQTSSVLNYSIIAISVVLFAYGWFVFSRLIVYNLAIERYRVAINKVRKYFVDLDTNLEQYLAVAVSEPEQKKTGNRLGGGLVGITALTNSLLLLVAGTVLSIEVAKLGNVFSLGLGLLLAFLSWCLHSFYHGKQVKNKLQKR